MEFRLKRGKPRVGHQGRFAFHPLLHLEDRLRSAPTRGSGERRPKSQVRVDLLPRSVDLHPPRPAACLMFSIRFRPSSCDPVSINASAFTFTFASPAPAPAPKRPRPLSAISGFPRPSATPNATPNKALAPLEAFPSPFRTPQAGPSKGTVRLNDLLDEVSPFRKHIDENDGEAEEEKTERRRLGELPGRRMTEDVGRRARRVVEEDEGVGVSPRRAKTGVRWTGKG